MDLYGQVDASPGPMCAPIDCSPVQSITLVSFSAAFSLSLLFISPSLPPVQLSLSPSLPLSLSPSPFLLCSSPVCSWERLSAQALHEGQTLIMGSCVASQRLSISTRCTSCHPTSDPDRFPAPHWTSCSHHGPPFQAAQAFEKHKLSSSPTPFPPPMCVCWFLHPFSCLGVSVDLQLASPAVRSRARSSVASPASTSVAFPASKHQVIILFPTNNFRSVSVDLQPAWPASPSCERCETRQPGGHQQDGRVRGGGEGRPQGVFQYGDPGDSDDETLDAPKGKAAAWGAKK